MALPSQTGRTSASSRTYVYRGKGRRSKLGPIVGVLVLAAGAALIGWRMWSDRAPGEGALASAEAAALAATNEPEPVVIDQGRSPLAPIVPEGERAGAATTTERPRGSDRAETEAARPMAAPTSTPTSSPSVRLSEPGALSEAIRAAEGDDREASAERAAPAVPPSRVNTAPASTGERRPAGVAGAIAEADRLLSRNDPVGARRVLNGALLRAEPGDAGPLRDRLTTLNDDLVFSPRVYPGVDGTESYSVAAGDTLSRIAYRRDLAVDWRLIQRVNRIANPSRIRVGQSLKLVRGPFHAVVDKSDFRLDLYQGPPEEPDRWTYIRSFTVGLGEDNGTPVGVFRVRPDSKLVNPRWTNPRTGEHFEADDPENPIGEYWIGLQGLGESAVWEGYGIHGTIEPDSIGQERSMGCVRLGSEDVAFVYELLVDGLSVVVIEP